MLLLFIIFPQSPIFKYLNYPLNNLCCKKKNYLKNKQSPKNKRLRTIVFVCCNHSIQNGWICQNINNKLDIKDLQLISYEFANMINLNICYFENIEQYLENAHNCVFCMYFSKATEEVEELLLPVKLLCFKSKRRNYKMCTEFENIIALTIGCITWSLSRKGRYQKKTIDFK